MNSSAGTVVAPRAADSQSGLLWLRVGSWSAALQPVIEQPSGAPAGQMWTSCHALERLCIHEINSAEVGNAYRWLKRCWLGDDTQEGYALMEEVTRSVPPCVKGALALLGPDLTKMEKPWLRWGSFATAFELQPDNLGASGQSGFGRPVLCYKG